MVASFTDAWIETRDGLLKISSFRSHLLQMRGLKQFLGLLSSLYQVASFTDAWIETIFKEPVHLIRKSHLLQMRGLKPVQKNNNNSTQSVASFTDAWIETF